MENQDVLKDPDLVLGRLINHIIQMSYKERQMLLNKMEQGLLNEDTCLEERDSARKICTIAVDYMDLNRIVTDFIGDISTSGAFMKSERAFKIGDELFLSIKFPKEQNPFKIPAQVIRTAPAGVGLKFKFKSQVQEAIIASLIRNLNIQRAEEIKEKVQQKNQRQGGSTERQM